MLAVSGPCHPLSMWWIQCFQQPLSAHGVIAVLLLRSGGGEGGGAAQGSCHLLVLLGGSLLPHQRMWLGFQLPTDGGPSRARAVCGTYPSSRLPASPCECSTVLLNSWRGGEYIPGWRQFGLLLPVVTDQGP